MNDEPNRPPHLWRPGQSGNALGRAPGSGEVARLRAAIREHVPAIIERLVQAALTGDVGAARLLLERVCAPLKASEDVNLLALPDGSLSEQGRSVLAAVAAGEIAVGQGAALLSSLGALAKITETDDLARRIASLEALSGVKG